MERWRWETVRPFIGTAARLGLAAVWLISGWLKVADPTQTRQAVNAYRLLSESATRLVAELLPFVELALGLVLLLGLAVRLTAVLSALVLMTYIAAVISVAVRGIPIDCGCFGGGGQVAVGDTHYVAEILRDVGFLALAAWLICWPLTAWSVDRWALRRFADGHSEKHDAAGVQR